MSDTSSYELMVVLAPSYMEQSKTPREAVEKLLKQVKAEVLSTDDWGEKSLAYDVDGHDKGYYLVYSINLKRDQAQEFTTRIKLVKGVMRWLLTKKDA